MPNITKPAPYTATFKNAALNADIEQTITLATPRELIYFLLDFNERGTGATPTARDANGEEIRYRFDGAGIHIAFHDGEI